MPTKQRKPRAKRELISEFSCPHCGKPVELVSQGELTNDYNLRPNPVQHARSQGTFPMPVLQFENRTMWLRRDIEKYIEERSLERIASLVRDFEQTIAHLPPQERQRARELMTSADGRK